MALGTTRRLTGGVSLLDRHRTANPKRNLKADDDDQGSHRGSAILLIALDW